MYPLSNTSIPVLNQAEASYHIDQFVSEVLKKNDRAYTFQSHAVPPYRVTSLGLDLQYLSQMIALFDGRVDYDFSENLNLFIDACHDIRLEYDGYRYICSDPGGNGSFLSEPEAMNLLVERIRELDKQGYYGRSVVLRRHHAKRQAEEVQAFVQRVMERYSKTLVVRVNLYYRSIARQWLSVDQVFEDMDRLAQARRTNPIFKHLVGSIIRVEQGQDQGFHLHTAFFFNGSDVFREACVAERIGELWVDITQNRGYWHDSGREWRDSGRKQQEIDEHRGTGMFRRSDTRGRGAVARLMIYLVKDKDQYLRVKPAGARAYRTGCIQRR